MWCSPRYNSCLSWNQYCSQNIVFRSASFFTFFTNFKTVWFSALLENPWVLQKKNLLIFKENYNYLHSKLKDRMISGCSAIPLPFSPSCPRSVNQVQDYLSHYHSWFHWFNFSTTPSSISRWLILPSSFPNQSNMLSYDICLYTTSAFNNFPLFLNVKFFFLTSLLISSFPFFNFNFILISFNWF